MAFNSFGLMVRRRAQRAVSNHGSKFGLAAILRDALASLGLLRMRSEWWKDSQSLRVTEKPGARGSAYFSAAFASSHSASISSSVDSLGVFPRAASARSIEAQRR